MNRITFLEVVGCSFFPWLLVIAFDLSFFGTPPKSIALDTAIPKTRYYESTKKSFVYLPSEVVVRNKKPAGKRCGSFMILLSIFSHNEGPKYSKMWHSLPLSNARGYFRNDASALNQNFK